MSDLAGFVRGLPKAELHLHLEGSLEPEMMAALAARNGVALPYASVAEIRQAYKFEKLQDFLDLYYRGMGVLQSARDFYDLTWAYLERAHRDGAIHVELFFDPQGHTARGIAFATVIDGVWAALKEGERKLGVSSYLIMCFLRHLSEEDGFRALDEAMPYRDRILGVGLDSSERGHPPAKFERLFAKAGALGFKRCAHAGEEGPAANVRDALDLLKVDRVDHGNHALDDPALIARLVAAGTTLTVCPLSNLRLRVVERMEDHPLKQMLALGIRATVNSDDPAYFGGYLADNYLAAAEALALSRSELAQLARNSLRGSFLPAAARRAALDRLDAYLASEGGADRPN